MMIDYSIGPSFTILQALNGTYLRKDGFLESSNVTQEFMKISPDTLLKSLPSQNLFKADLAFFMV